MPLKRHRPLTQAMRQSPLSSESPGQETIPLPLRREWRALVFPGLETILLLQPRAWVARPPLVPAKGQPHDDPRNAKAEHAHPSSREPVAPVVQAAAQVLRHPVQAQEPVVPVRVPVAVDQESVVVGEAPAVERLERLVAVVAKTSLASQSARSVKSLKCGRPPV